MPLIDSVLLKMANLVAPLSYPLSLEKLDIDPNTSLWASETEGYQPNPPLSEAIEVDVAIIGGGYTGVSTAYYLREHFPNYRIAIVEAKSLGNGASGRNGGMLLNRLHESDHVDDATYGRIYHATNDRIGMMIDIIEKNNLKVQYRRDGSLQIYTKPENADYAKEEVERGNRIGIPFQYLSPDELRQKINLSGDIYGAMFDPNEGQINGAQFVREMKKLLLARDVQIYEETPVIEIEPNREVQLKTPKGRVTAKSIVLATNGYTGKLGYFRKGFFPLHSHVIGTAPLTDAQLEQLQWRQVAGFSDDLNRLAYCVLTSDNRIVFGGGSNRSYAYLFNNKTAFRGNRTAGVEALKKTMYSYMPVLRDVDITHEWTGTLSITLQRNSSIGVTGDHNNIYYGFGYSGHGVTMANLSGNIIADMIAGEGDKWRGMPFYQNRLMPIPLDPFRWIGYQFFTHVLGYSPRVDMD